MAVTDAVCLPQRFLLGLTAASSDVLLNLLSYVAVTCVHLKMEDDEKFRFLSTHPSHDFCNRLFLLLLSILNVGIGTLTRAPLLFTRHFSQRFFPFYVVGLLF